mmetsp:Transcript_2468/g.4387  ORF Transcript_2468/g.4387 Transcript_2468/m.4387 type:complete len:95 (+) Transcript_2468:104-388(+)
MILAFPWIVLLLFALDSVFSKRVGHLLLGSFGRLPGNTKLAGIQFSAKLILLASSCKVASGLIIATLSFLRLTTPSIPENRIEVRRAGLIPTCY